MKTVRLGLIGLGNIGRHHATYLQAGKVPRCELMEFQLLYIVNVHNHLSFLT